MPSFTPRATAVHALARREAELLDQVPASGHVLVALIWEGGGIAAAALTEVGLAKSADRDIRRRLADASDSERGIGADDLHRAAAGIATDLGHAYVGTDHQLLAIINDASLSETVLRADLRERASAQVHGRLPRQPPDP